METSKPDRYRSDLCGRSRDEGGAVIRLTSKTRGLLLVWKTVSQYGLISSSGSSVDAVGQEVGHRLNWFNTKQRVETGCIPSDMPTLTSGRLRGVVT